MTDIRKLAESYIQTFKSMSPSKEIRLSKEELKDFEKEFDSLYNKKIIPLINNQKDIMEKSYNLIGRAKKIQDEMIKIGAKEFEPYMKKYRNKNTLDKAFTNFLEGFVYNHYNDGSFRKSMRKLIDERKAFKEQMWQGVKKWLKLREENEELFDVAEHVRTYSWKNSMYRGNDGYDLNPNSRVFSSKIWVSDEEVRDHLHPDHHISEPGGVIKDNFDFNGRLGQVSYPKSGI